MWNNIRNHLTNKNCIEFGGPTELFSNPSHNCMLYDIINSLDGVNIFENNPFQTILNTKYDYKYGIGNKFNIDVTSDEILKLNKYDCIISSHQLEHVANPIKTINKWKHLLDINSMILIIVPNKNHCFDSNRNNTTFDHILNDYKNNIDDSDMTHFNEIINTNSIPNMDNYIEQANNNIKTKIIHHHCFTLDVLKQLFEYCGFNTVECFNHETNKLQNVYLGKRSKE